jgi:prophage regulatory protein
MATDSLRSIMTRLDALTRDVSAIHEAVCEAPKPAQEPQGPRLLRLPKVLELVGLRTSRLYDLMKLGKFPQPYRLVEGGRSIGWREEEIRKWIEDRAKRETPAPAE